jgi:hypothetical protein
VKRIEQTRAWDRSRPETLRGIPKDGYVDPVSGKPLGLLTDTFTDAELAICQSEYIRQFQDRLKVLRVREAMRSGTLPVEGLEIEHKFARLLTHLRPKAVYPQNASYIETHFNAEERRVLFGLLDDIEEQVPWQGVLWYKVLKRLRKSKTGE